MIDTSASMENKLAIAQEAAMGFVRRMGPDDRIQIIDFDSQAKILPAFSRPRGAGTCDQTHGSRRIHVALQRHLHGDQRTEAHRAGDRPREPAPRHRAAVRRRGHVQHRAVGRRARSGQEGRRRGVCHRPARKAEAAPRTPRGWKQAEYDLKQLSRDTGGRVFFADDAAQLPRSTARLPTSSPTSTRWATCRRTPNATAPGARFRCGCRGRT